MASRGSDEEFVVAAHDTQPGGMGEGSAIHNARSSGQYVPIVDYNSSAMDIEGRINRTSGGEFSVQSRSSSSGEVGHFLAIAEGD